MKNSVNSLASSGCDSFSLEKASWVRRMTWQFSVATMSAILVLPSVNMLSPKNVTGSMVARTVSFDETFALPERRNISSFAGSPSFINNEFFGKVVRVRN